MTRLLNWVIGDTDKRWYAFRNLVRARDYAAAQKSLDADKALLGLRNQTGETVLHWLAVENEGNGVAWLRLKGADIDTKNKFGTPVIFEVAQLGYKDLFRWFVDVGADLKAVDQYGQGLAEYLEDAGKSEMAEFVREYAAP
jgi:ankyrin repeat protein